MILFMPWRYSWRKHQKAADHVDDVVATQKALLKTLKEDPNWPELGDIPQDLVDDLSKEPAPNPDEEPAMNWATADKLYKSEAIDAFGVKYILGIFESPIDAVKAFKDWSDEYKKARSGVKDELVQKSQEANAKLQADKMAAKEQSPMDGPER